ncbi:MAG: FG-GAP repeat domain-containing protein, partial [Isosphaeraceae bacterium]
MLALTGCGKESAGPAPANTPVAQAKKPESQKTVDAPAEKKKPGGEGRMVGDRLSGVQSTVSGTPRASQDPSPFKFTEITKEAGIDFVHVSGMTEKKYFPTANGSGVALIDADNDGLLDIYFLTNCPLPVDKKMAPSNKFYKNLGNGKFKDMTS